MHDNKIKLTVPIALDIIAKYWSYFNIQTQKFNLKLEFTKNELIRYQINIAIKKYVLAESWFYSS